MATAKGSERQKFLEEASSLLLACSPPISGHLRLASEEQISGDAHATPNTTSCSACGNLFVPGWSYKTLTKTRCKPTRSDRIQKDRTEVKTVRLQCLRWDAVTTIDSPKPNKIESSSKLRVQEPIAKAVDTPQSISRPPESNTTENTAQSWRRGRGKKSTLQSMLHGQNLESSTRQKGFGLDLTDFMKT